MEHKTYTYENSRRLFERALKVIPSACTAIRGRRRAASSPWTRSRSFPSGRRAPISGTPTATASSTICAPTDRISWGYGDPDVDEAARRQREKEDCVTAPSPVMIDFAELLVDTVQTADWAFFAKNGQRRHHAGGDDRPRVTRRKKIVFFKGYYHGVSPWTQKIDYSGVLKEDVCNNLYADWNDFEGLEALFEAHKGEIAAVISQPYMHGNFADNELPADGFWQKVRRLCTEQGALLIVDDVRAGFRLSLAGSDSYFGFEADLICFCKAIANGYNVSALCGRDFLKNNVSGISFTGSYWLSAVPFAAGIACLEKMKKLNLPELLIEKGKRLTDGLDRRRPQAWL